MCKVLRLERLNQRITKSKFDSYQNFIKPRRVTFHPCRSFIFTLQKTQHQAVADRDSSLSQGQDQKQDIKAVRANTADPNHITADVESTSHRKLLRLQILKKQAKPLSASH